MAAAPCAVAAPWPVLLGRLGMRVGGGEGRAAPVRGDLSQGLGAAG